TDGYAQGGFVVWPGPTMHAVLWTSSPGAYTDLSVGEAESEILGMVAGIQVGVAIGRDSVPHAAVWHGSAQSFADYNPPSWNTRLLATSGRVHAGQGGPGGALHALINLGGPNSWIDLHSFLPPGYSV